jgi:hypothetical protein
VNPEVMVLEQITRVGPLGVRFWDVAAMSPAGAGIKVVGYPDAFPELRFEAGMNHTGVYFFYNLPGMRDVENGDGDEEFWTNHPPKIPYTVEVSDPQQRYLPYQFSVLMPSHGLFGLVDSPLSGMLTPDATWLPVFSAPSRVMPGPTGVVHALLKDATLSSPLEPPDNLPPAAWALVTAQASGVPLMTGLADDRGAVSLSIPYPEPRNSPFASPLVSPLGTGSLRLSDQTWPLNISVFYRSSTSVGQLPDLLSILRQPLAKSWSDTAHSTPANTFTLKFGTELVLRSVDSATSQDLAVLLITTS